MTEPPLCPFCDSGFVYDDGIQWVCPDCGHEWWQETDPEADENRGTNQDKGAKTGD